MGSRSVLVLACCVAGCGARSALQIGDAGGTGAGGAPSTSQSSTSGGGTAGSGAGSCAAGESKSCYSGPPGTLGVGVCAAGVQTCDADRFGPCMGEVLPALDDCSTGDDEDCDGAGGWAQRYGGVGGDLGGAIAVDGAGNVVLAGKYTGAVDFGGGPLVEGSPTSFVLALDAEGHHLWSRGLLGAKSIVLAVDGSDVVLAGEYEGVIDLGGGAISTPVPGFSDIFVARLDAGGAHIWSKAFGGAGNDSPAGVAVDGSGDLLLAGQLGAYVAAASVDFGGGPLSKQDGGAFVVKLSAAGDHVWSKGLAKPDDAIRTLAVDAAGNPIVAGHSHGPIDLGGGVLPRDQDVMHFFVAKLDPSGGHVWSAGFGGLTSTGPLKAAGDVVVGVASTPDGGAAITGYFSDVIDFGGGLLSEVGVTDVFVAQLDALGGHVHSASFGGPSSDTARGIAVDAQGRIVVTGSHWDDVDFGGGILAGQGENDIFILKRGADGTYLGAETHGGKDDDFGSGVAVDSSGTVFFAGWFQEEISFGPCLLESAGSTDVVVAKLGL